MQKKILLTLLVFSLLAACSSKDSVVYSKNFTNKSIRLSFDDIDLSGFTTIKQTNSQSQKTNENITIHKDEVVISSKDYTEKIFMLPFVRANKDFSIIIQKGNFKSDSFEETLKKLNVSKKNPVYDSITYPIVGMLDNIGYIQIGNIYIAISKKGKLLFNGLIAVDSKKVIPIKYTVNYEDIVFSVIEETTVLAGKENYKIIYKGKKGSELLFEKRIYNHNNELLKKSELSIPLSATSIDVWGHILKVQTATSETLQYILEDKKALIK